MDSGEAMTVLPQPGTGSMRTPGRGAGQRGFSLIEALTVISILSVLTAMAIPSMTAMLRNGKLRGTGSDLFGDMLVARSEAVKQNCNVTVTPTGGAWTGGWQVASVAACGNGAVTLVQHPALDGDIKVLPAGTASTITYGPTGRVSAGLQTVIFYENVSGTEARCVGVDASGVPRITVDTNGKASDGCN